MYTHCGIEDCRCRYRGIRRSLLTVTREVPTTPLSHSCFVCWSLVDDLHKLSLSLSLSHIYKVLVWIALNSLDDLRLRFGEAAFWRR